MPPPPSERVPPPPSETMIAQSRFLVQKSKMSISMERIFVQLSFWSLKQLSPNTCNKPKTNKEKIPRVPRLSSENVIKILSNRLFHPQIHTYCLYFGQKQYRSNG